MSHFHVARIYDIAKRRIQKTEHGSYEYGDRISRETGSAVPCRVSLPILHTQAESGAIYIRSIHYR